MVQSRCKCTAIDQYKERHLTYVWFRKEQEDINLQKMLLEESIDKYDENRDKIRQKARQQIQKMQEENKRHFSKKRNSARTYVVGNLVAIKKTQLRKG